VPSTRHAIDRHPLAELARQVRPSRPDHRFLLDLGPSAHDKTRTVLPDRFTVPDRYRPLLSRRSIRATRGSDHGTLAW
jgi:hypothetical protein